MPVHELALMMSIALRFIPTLMEETEKIMKAQTARGVDFSSGPIKDRVKSIVPLLVPLFVSSFKRAEELAISHGIPRIPWWGRPYKIPSIKLED